MSEHGVKTGQTNTANDEGRPVLGTFLDNDEYRNFRPSDSRVAFKSVRYEDRLLVEGFNGGYVLMTGSDCEHFEPRATASAATQESLPGTKICDNWTTCEWTTSNRLFVEKELWDPLDDSEKEEIQAQGWKVFLGI